MMLAGVESCSGDGELGPRPLWPKGHAWVGGCSLRQWLMFLAQKEKALSRERG